MKASFTVIWKKKKIIIHFEIRSPMTRHCDPCRMIVRMLQLNLYQDSCTQRQSRQARVFSTTGMCCHEFTFLGLNQRRQASRPGYLCSLFVFLLISHLSGSAIEAPCEFFPFKVALVGSILQVSLRSLDSEGFQSRWHDFLQVDRTICGAICDQQSHS